MTDILEEASGIAELRDFTRLEAFVAELTSEIRQLSGTAAADSPERQAEVGDLTTRLLLKHQMPQPWTYLKLREIMGLHP